MSKTKKNCRMEITYTGIHEWYKSLFEKLGWMVLSKEHNIDDKVELYKDSLYRLKDCMIKKHKQIKDVDKKEDLRIMLNNLEVLIKHVEKDFK
jgi:hypothetical protein